MRRRACAKKLFYLPMLALIAILALYNLKTGVSLAQNINESDIEKEITDIKGGIEGKQTKIEDLKKQMAIYEKRIKGHRNQAYTINNQIKTLDAQSDRTGIAIEVKNLEIGSASQKIRAARSNISSLDRSIEDLKSAIAALLYDLYIADETSPLEIFILNDSLSDYFQDLDSLETFSAGIEQKLDEVEKKKSSVEVQKLALEEEKLLLEQLKYGLEEEKENLSSQKTAKNILLNETKKNEAKFQGLLKEVRAEQAEIDAEIVRLEKELRKKLLEKADLEKNLNAFIGEGFIWPVTRNIITAKFRDPSYPFRNIFEHPAIDIKSRQGSTIKASASGYVGKVQRDTKCTGRYAYIMIIHANNFSTVYGHLNRIDVEEEQFVAQGQRIALSGGRPGSCGSGRLTTGPHMHFEVRKNGIPQDPLLYLK